MYSKDLIMEMLQSHSVMSLVKRRYAHVLCSCDQLSLQKSVFFFNDSPDAALLVIKHVVVIQQLD